MFKAFKELNNYLFLIKTIRKNRKTEAWKKLNIRHDKLFRIYTVVNLPIEVVDSDNLYHGMWVIEYLKPLNDYLMQLNLAEIISVNTTQIDKENYLAVYKPIFNDFGFWWLVKWSAVITAIVGLQNKYDWFQYIIVAINFLKTFF